ncbi:Valyl-tRNA synthetase [hydrothermal vent metagenome]|uniref:valine--tRNA ligase n=1 Tax=hydrothermal vent metagenome TaxID=652676 RepID=A0A1W1C8E4_9ZZZZ
MEKTYQSDVIEKKHQKKYNDENAFSIEHNKNSDNAYCIMLPPPNVTGTLHMGHAFQHTIMDILVRHQRMKQKQTLWQAGTDHAGIATQMVVERQLNAENQTRHDLGRDKFVERIWQWKEKSGGIITSQMKRLGTSVDWSRERFTMDDELSIAVNKVFVDLYNEDLIYRGKRLVNWDPVLETAVSDLEVISEEENGSLWHLKYPISGTNEFIVVATTRPETLLGDSAVAVHPDDDRYKNLIGKTIDLPLTNRKIPIIADDYVDKDFGTGCVKITPAHDFNDNEMGKRHQLEEINILTKDAKINKNAPEKYQGLDRFVARKQIIKDFDELGLLVEIKPHRLMIPRGDRTGSVIEPYLTDQWFVKVESLAKPAIDAVKNGDIRFIPKNWENTYFNWMDNIQDWCISRQIWWGHRIPAWYDEEGKVYVANTLEDAQKQAGDKKISQDNDVLDTWFSSALWPFSTLGWPEKTPELERFYPTNVLVTGFDIIFFWVARMIMFGLKFTDKVPFKDIYITGLVRDASGAKMSKSKGNVLDPIDLIDGISLEDLITKRTQGLMQPKMAKKIEKQTQKDYPQGIASFGADALRFTFCALASFGRDIKFDLKRIEGYRNFCNKLWNASRYISLKVDFKNVEEITELSVIDKWILSNLQQTKVEVEGHIANYRLDLMAQVLYEFVWHNYCDWYVEFSKTLENEQEKKANAFVITKVLSEILKLLHPVIPFITEEISESLFSEKLVNANYPKIEKQFIDKQSELEVDWVKQFGLGIRKIRGEMNIKQNKALICFVDNLSEQDKKYLDKYQKTLCKLLNLESIQQKQNDEEYATTLVGEMLVLIPLKGLVDKKEEIKRLTKEIDKLKSFEKQLLNKLNNEKFISGAPKEVVEREKNKLMETKKSLETFTQQIEGIQKL